MNFIFEQYFLNERSTVYFPVKHLSLYYIYMSSHTRKNSVNSPFRRYSDPMYVVRFAAPIRSNCRFLVPEGEHWIVWMFRPFNTLPRGTKMRRRRRQWWWWWRREYFAAQRAKQQFIFLTREKCRFAWLRPLLYDHNALPACNHNALQLSFIMTRSARVLSRAKEASYSQFYSFWKWYSWEDYQISCVQQSLSVDKLVDLII